MASSTRSAPDWQPAPTSRATAPPSSASRALLAERGRPIFETATSRFGFTGDSELADLVAHHHAQGEFRPDLPLTFVQRTVLVIVNHAPDLLDIDEPAELEPQIHDLLRFVEHGLGREETS